MNVTSLLGRLLVVVLVALVPAITFQAYTEIGARQVRQQLVEEEALRLVRLVSSEQQRIIEGAEQVLDVLAGSPAVQDNLPDNCRRLLSNILVSAPRYNHVAVIGLDGRIVCTSNPSGIGTDLSDRPYFQDALRTGGMVVGEYTIGRNTGKPALPIAKPFRDGTGNVAGVVEIALSLDWLGQQLDRVSLPKGAFVRVADRNGIILAHQTANVHYTGEPIPEGAHFSLEGNTDAVSLVRGLSGAMRVMAYAPIRAEPVGLAVAVGLDPEVTFAAMDRANRTGLILIVLGGGMALLLTALVGNRLIRRPVAQLLDAAANWRTGALAVRTTLRKDKSEFGRLGIALDDMAAALEAREQALRMALESTTDAVIAVDRTWHFTYLNQHARALAGGGDLVGQPFWGAIPDLEQAAFVTACRTAMASYQPAKIEMSCDRTQKQFAINAYPSEDGLTLYIHEFTERRRVAMALQESETRLQLIRDAAGFGIWDQEIMSGTSVWSDQQWRLHGYKPRQGGPDLQTWSSMVHPEDRERVVDEGMTAIIDPGQPFSSEHRVVWPNGAVHWLMNRATVVRDPAGEAVRIVGVSMDVTASRETEAALRESETRLRLAREAAGFGVWDRDVASGTGVWSEQEWRLHGREPRQGGPDLETWASMVHPEDRDRVVAARRVAIIDPERPYVSEHRVVWPSGSIHWLLSRATVVRDATGEAVRIVGVSMDVTASRETEAALRRLSNELEQRVREEVAAREAAQARAAQAERVQALGQLAGGIAHDFNNVLQAVSGAMTLIERRPGDEAGIRRLARLANEATERGASITRRLLTFGRGGDLLTESLDVPALLFGLQEVLTHTLGANIAVSIRLDAELPPIKADKRQLETVLVNLATNARDAMPGGGRLTLSAETETVSALDPHPDWIGSGSYVRLAVSDTGTGMDAETLARAREPFFTTKKLGAGTGLGLAMAQNFAEQSGGALRLESRLGEGTTITLWLPRADVEDAGAVGSHPTDAAAWASGPAVSLRVLVVDDENAIREVLADYLEDAGYSVVPAADGAEALALLASEPKVDALITDLSMPGMDGLAVIRAARERYPALPTILLTGYAGDDAALALGCAIGGAVSLLRKPVSDVQLLDRLSAMLAVGGEDWRQTASPEAVC